MSRETLHNYLPGLPFLDGVYSSLTDSERKKIKWSKEQNYNRVWKLASEVADGIFRLLREGHREFPTLEIKDPLDEVEVPTQLDVFSYNELVRIDKNKRKSSTDKPFIQEEASVNLISPYRHSPCQHTSLGGLVIKTYPLLTQVKSISLSRSGNVCESVETTFGYTSNLEAVALMVHANNYLNELQ